MGFKNNDRCLKKVADDEPIFVLRAQDRLAPAIVMAWVNAALEFGLSDERVQDATNIALAMKKWPNRKFPD